MNPTHSASRRRLSRQNERGFFVPGRSGNFGTGVMEYPNPGVRIVSFGVQGRFSGAQSTRHDEQECLCAVYAEQAIPLLVALRDFIADVIALRGFRANKDIVL